MCRNRDIVPAPIQMIRELYIMNTKQKTISQKRSSIVRKAFSLLLVPVLSLSLSLSGAVPVHAADVVRNTKFTTVQEMKTKLGTSDSTTWSPVYLTEVENTYWTFADQKDLGGTKITIEMAKNCYRNLEMLLDNGYTMDYNELSAYCEEYLEKKERAAGCFL